MKKLIRYCLIGSAVMMAAKDVNNLSAQTADLRLLDWQPKSQLVVKETKIDKPKFPVIDIHNHLHRWEKMGQFLQEMDKAGVTQCVNLDAFSEQDDYLEQIKKTKELGKNRIILFFVPDFSKIDEPEFAVKEAKKLEEAVKMGVRGLKIHKELGLTVKDKTGKLVPVDDPRIDPLWAKCGELKIPVMIHVSDPKAFFTPLDKYNERYDELAAHPGWLFYGKDYPAKEEILAQRNRMMAKHPDTIFIGAHVGGLPEDLGQLSQWLDTYPNFYVDICARINELGRQPYTARKFFIKYQDRILFGTDTPCDAEAYRIFYRFLETDDEYFDPAGGHHLQGRWMIYGVFLPDEVLEKVYHKNAEKILSLFQPPKTGS